MTARQINVISITLRKVNDVGFLNQMYFSIKGLPCYPQETRLIPYKIYATLKIVEISSIEPATSWLIVKANQEDNEVVSNNRYNNNNNNNNNDIIIIIIIIINRGLLNKMFE